MGTRRPTPTDYRRDTVAAAASGQHPKEEGENEEEVEEVEEAVL